MDSEVRNFTGRFFQQIGCDVRAEGDLLRADNVPEQFESFVGKKGPFVFGFDDSSQREGVEVLKKGGYFLNAMANFLQTKSKITLVKLDVPLDAEREVLTRFTFPNAKILDVKKTFSYGVVTRFLFTTKFQYMNEREHETLAVFLKDGKVFDVDPLSLYESGEGNKKDIQIPDFSGEYEKAREVVKGRVKGKVERISKVLKERMQQELGRIESHYKTQIKELRDSYDSLVSQLGKLDEEVKKKEGEAREKILSKISRLRDEIKHFDFKTKEAGLEQERELAMKEEKGKYKLGVGHHLMNTSVIYYPVFTLLVKLGNGRAQGPARIFYDPVQKYMSPVICPASKMKIYKVYLDDAGVVCSGESLMECFESGKHYCSSSMTARCGHSGKMIHPSQAGVCEVTRKTFGKSYLKEDSVSGKMVYQNLLSYCVSCNKYALEKKFTKCPSCKTSVCPNCLRKGFREGKIYTYCGACKD